MSFDSNLRSLPFPKLSESILKGPIKRLKEISEKNGDPKDSKPFKDRKQALIKALKSRKQNGRSFERVTDVLGRERLLLSIYLDHLGRNQEKHWLPPFDTRIAQSVLGDSGKAWHGARARQVALFFFTHFDRIEALEFVCQRLCEAYANPKKDYEPVRTWQKYHKTLFNPDGPEKIARQGAKSVSVDQLVTQYAIPEGRFAEKLRQCLLLEVLRETPFGEVDPVFEEIETLKDKRAFSKYLLGAAALEILVQRVQTEGKGQWPEKWPEWILRFGCDPRHGRASANGAKWWGWATDSELRLAKQGIIGRDLGFFIQFLRNSLSGTGKEGQFERRHRFLKALFHSGKIKNAKLVLNQATFRQLDREYRNDIYSLAKLVETRHQTSMICLDCTDEIQIIEGTHNFGLRVFHPHFPIKGFWEDPSKSYQDRKLRITPKECDIFLPHDPHGKWVEHFFNQLRSEFHVEWDDMDI